MTIVWRSGAAAAVVVALAASASGQTGSIQKRLAAAKSLTCTFSTLATGTWKDGAAAAEVTASSLKLTYSNIDVEDGTADAESDFGDTFIVVRYEGDYLHLMQSHRSGPLYTTTVMARETKEGRLIAVHTRHEYTDVRLPGFTSRPEMYVGDCAVG